MKRLEIDDEVYVRVKNSKIIMRTNLDKFILAMTKKEGSPFRIVIPFDGIKDLVSLDNYKQPAKYESTNYQTDIGYDDLCPLFSYAFQFENHVW